MHRYDYRGAPDSEDPADAQNTAGLWAEYLASYNAVSFLRLRNARAAL